MKKLEMYNPIVDSFCIYGNLFSILPQTDYVDNWICNNFLQLKRVNPVIFFESYRSVFFNCPHISRTLITRKVLYSRWNGEIYNLIKELIDEHYYVFFYVDRSCINIYNTSERNIHEFFVYGYDDERKILYCADNLSTGKYTLFESDIESVVRGYQNVSGYNYFTDIVGISNEVSDEWFEEIKFNQLIGLYRDYAESRLTSNFGERFNVSECGFILQEKEIIKLSNNINRARDIRDFCIFRDHKKLMSYRFDILSKRYNGINFDNVCRSYKLCKKEWDLLISLCIKYSLFEEIEDYQNALEHGYKAIDIEKEVLDETLQLFETISMEK